ncbi:glycosyltransferase [Sphingomonas ginkgonis]|nr:glycosyltransferase [Sphingomonas ginkgonis]
MRLAGKSVGVVYVSDRNYHELTLFSIASLALFLKERVSITLFQVGYEQPLDPALAAYLAKVGHRIEVVPLASRDPSHEEVQLHEHISPASLLKADAIDAVAPRHDLVVFLDGDTLFMRPCSFESLPEFTTSFAGVYNFLSYMPFWEQDLIGHTERTGVSSDYFNSGVIFIRSERWIALGLRERYRRNLVAHEARCPYRHDAEGNDPRDCVGSDQCAFNMSVEHDWTPLDFRWNMQKTTRHMAGWRHALIRHYTGHRKFLTTSNRHRDAAEYRVLSAIREQVGLRPARPIHYRDRGLVYALDYAANFKLMLGYGRLLRKLSAKMAGGRATERAAG